MSFTNDDVVAILALLDASRFDELRVETADFKLHLRRSAQAKPGRSDAQPNEAAQTPATPAPVATGSRPAPPRADGVDVTAPLLGTFYASPQPGAPPFVTIGSVVDETTVIGIVEVMKLMNSVPAGIAGTVTAILARDGELVEYDQPLVRIAPNPS